MPFKSLTVADVKTIARLSIFNIFDLNNELVKLSLFDKLILEDESSCGITSETISKIDYFSFLLGIRRLLNNEVAFSFNCKTCNETFKDTFDLEEKFEEEIQNYKRKRLIFEKTDHAGVTWKFELNSYTMKDFLYYKFYLNEIQNIENEEYQNDALLKPLLYITKVFKNGEEIEDWSQHTFIDKLEFFKTVPGEIIIGASENINKNNFLLPFIQENFDEERMITFTSNIIVTCSNCGEKYNNVYDFDDFFYILGYEEDNQQVYSNILESESYLIYYHWFSIDQINNMSYLDFSIYSERIIGLYEQEQKQREEELKAQEAQMESIEISYD